MGDGRIETIQRVTNGIGWRITMEDGQWILLTLTDNRYWSAIVSSWTSLEPHMLYYGVKPDRLASLIGAVLRKFRGAVMLVTDSATMALDAANKQPDFFPIDVVHDRTRPCGFYVELPNEPWLALGEHLERLCRTDLTFGAGIVWLHDETTEGLLRVYRWPGLLEHTIPTITSRFTIVVAATGEIPLMGYFFKQIRRRFAEWILPHLRDGLIQRVLHKATNEELVAMFQHHTVVADDETATDVNQLRQLGMSLSPPAVYAPRAIQREVLQALVSRWLFHKIRDIGEELVELRQMIFAHWWRLPASFPRRLLHEQIWLQLDDQGGSVAICNADSVTESVLMHMVSTHPRIPQRLYETFCEKRAVRVPAAPRKKKQKVELRGGNVVLDFD